MNNYKVFQDYYNYINNNYNKPIYNQDVTKNNIFDPYNGFIRGNLFPQLYNQYKVEKPIEIRPMNEQAEMLTYIDAFYFACIDLSLYLDTHPDDKDALKLFNQYRQSKKEYIEQYENKYGPLNKESNSLNSYPWMWNNSPWPWERGV